ncbi:hypothetical protein ALC56_05246 [Trachymyrmex septentrionalis]|uniref:CHK kinase-like domain-containing protein n=1 Tax=Trachymyrmex septentrionalis TaxID=34720 RepID=A0A195FIV3_9HYME|nr:PREDICTED: uncharacterized protein LOC108747576 [Trachymyrmex septentrionalis]KYN40301.1 hypothetical protein ALC56_05246 [Trachymyrmex septentrionalis]
MSNDQQELKTIELRELQPILSRTFGDQLIVVHYTTKNLLQPGENYGSSILSVHAVIKRNDESEEEDLYLIAKMSPPTEFQRQIFDSPFTFKKEIFMYENIVPYYQELEKEMGLKENEIFDILPKYYQSRLSLTPNVDFDDNAVILMENLRTRGYYNGDRAKGCDLEHSRVAIRAMARFHALGMATKYKRPEYFEILKERSKCVKFNMEEFEHFQADMLKMIAEDSELSVYVDRCEAAIRDSFTHGFWTMTPDEPWSTIIHADFWVNNIMFHRDENGHVDDIKFVDFQNYLFFSPLREMVFFLFSSTEILCEDHIEELIDLYHETFLAVLNRMDCDIEPFSREKFDAKLLIDARLESMHLFFMLKILTLNVQETELKHENMKDVLMSYQGNQLFIQRLRKVMLYFIKHDWI